MARLTGNLRRAGSAMGLLLLWACSSNGGAASNPVPDVASEPDPGKTVTASLELEALDELTQELEQRREDTPDELRERHAPEFQEDLGYDPLTAAGLDEIENALISRTASYRERLTENGFVVVPSGFPSFAYGYSEIYLHDLPVFISADMVLEAIYRSHDKILQTLEKRELAPRLQNLLKAIRAELVRQLDTLSPEVASDLNFFLGVALALLDGGHVDSSEPEGVAEFVAAAMQADGEQRRVIFGVERRMDFSQFKPRGHYAEDPDLESYFRAMIWLGRIDFRLIETQPDGSQLFRRRQLDSVLALRRLLSENAFERYRAIDDTISAFVGEHDYMTLQDVDALLAALGNPDNTSSLDDETLASALVEGQFGKQRIASHVMRKETVDGTFPLNTSFALFGQRYTVDSHVLSNVVYDRVPTRVVPNALDVAFGALANGQALALLGDELDEQPGFAGQLSATRALVDEHPAAYWKSSLYTSWLSALRTLSPAVGEQPDALPSVARTDAWGRRILNTQLASWAQLRHNNLLYVKQSYTSSAGCEYPDAYVDPYPDFFLGIVSFAERAQEVISELQLDADLVQTLGTYFQNVARINDTLAQMAEAQRTGAPHSEEHLAFINQAINVNINCDGTILGHDGWYSELYIDPLEAVEMDPIITDVHTDIGGDLPVQRPPSVLHVGTALPRLIVMTVDSCQGPRAYAGLVSAYQETLEEGLTRLTDEEWKRRINSPTAPGDVAWLAPIVTE